MKNRFGHKVNRRPTRELSETLSFFYHHLSWAFFFLSLLTYRERRYHSTLEQLSFGSFHRRDECRYQECYTLERTKLQCQEGLFMCSSVSPCITVSSRSLSLSFSTSSL